MLHYRVPSLRPSTAFSDCRGPCGDPVLKARSRLYQNRPFQMRYACFSVVSQRGELAGGDVLVEHDALQDLALLELPAGNLLHARVPAGLRSVKLAKCCKVFARFCKFWARRAKRPPSSGDNDSSDLIHFRQIRQISWRAQQGRLTSAKCLGFL